MGINIACFTGAREDSVATPQTPLLHGTLLVLQVHVRIASPPLKHPCYMGINIATWDIATLLVLQVYVRIASPPLTHPCYMGINIACFRCRCTHVRIASPPLKHPCYMGINIACFTGARQDSVTSPQAPLLHGYQYCLFYRCTSRIASPPLKHPCYMGINIACFTGACQDSVATPQAPLLHGHQHSCFTTLLVLQVQVRQDSVASPQAPLATCLFYRCKDCLFSTLLVQVHVRIASPPLKHPCYMGINIACFTGARQDSVTSPQAPLLHGYQYCLFYRCTSG